MNIKQAIERIIDDPSVIKKYFRGTFWYDVYRLNRRLVPERIRTYAELRWFKLARKECASGRTCIGCGCNTPAKFFDEGACEADIWLGEEPCYPAMPTRKEWEEIKKARK